MNTSHILLSGANPPTSSFSSVPTSTKLQSLHATLNALEIEKQKRQEAEKRASELRQKLASSLLTLDTNYINIKHTTKPIITNISSLSEPIIPPTLPISSHNSLLLTTNNSSTTSVKHPTTTGIASFTSSIPNNIPITALQSISNEHHISDFHHTDGKTMDQSLLSIASASSIKNSSVTDLATFLPTGTNTTTTNSNSDTTNNQKSTDTLSIIKSSSDALVPLERKSALIASLLPTNMETTITTLSDKVRQYTLTNDNLERQLNKEQSIKNTLQLENQQLKKELEQLKIKLTDESKGAISVLRQNEVHSNETITRLETHIAALGKQLVTIQAEAGSNAALAEERQNRISNLIGRLEVARKEAETADNERRKLQSSVITMETRIQRNETQIQILENERNTLKQRLSDMATEITELRRSNTQSNVSPSDNEQKLRFEHQIAVAETRSLTLERELITLRESRSTLLATMREADANLERLSLTVQQGEERENNVRQELAAVLGERARIVAELTARATQAEKDNIGVRTRVDTMLSQVAEAERRVTQYAERLTTVEHQYNESQQLLNNARAELLTRTSEIDSLHNQINSMAAANELLNTRYFELQQQLQEQSSHHHHHHHHHSQSASSIASDHSHSHHHHHGHSQHQSLPNSSGSTAEVSSKDEIQSTYVEQNTASTSSNMVNNNKNTISDPVSLLHANVPSLTTQDVKPLIATSFRHLPLTGEEKVIESLPTVEGSISSYLPKKIKQQHTPNANEPSSTLLKETVASSHGRPMSPPPHHSATLQVIQANHRRVNGALTSVLFAGPQFLDRLKTIKKLIEEHATKQIIIALVTSGNKSAGQFAGIYIVLDSTTSSLSTDNSTLNNTSSVSQQIHLATRIFGHGPLTIYPSMIHTLFKYDTATREFRDIGFSVTNQLPVSTDAIGIDPSWLSVAKREKRLGGTTGENNNRPSM